MDISWKMRQKSKFYSAICDYKNVKFRDKFPRKHLEKERPINMFCVQY